MSMLYVSEHILATCPKFTKFLVHFACGLALFRLVVLQYVDVLPVMTA